MAEADSTVRKPTCIYYRDIEGLTFDSQEHVIPAAIGGRSKLPMDYVSSKFNNDISALEREMIRRSLVSMPREIEGPGKRGRLGERHETKSEIRVLGDANDPSKFALGYVRKGTGYEIHQVMYNTDTGFGEVRVHSPAEILDFKKSCENADIKKLRTIIDHTLPRNKILFGIAKGIERHYDLFFAKNKSNKFELNADVIREFGEGIRTNASGTRQTYEPIFNKKVVFDINHLRIFAKIAFNYLAFGLGKDFVLRSEFDQIRYWIANGGTNDFAGLIIGGSNPFDQTGIDPPESFHLIYIGKREQSIVARVILYNTIGVDITLAKEFIDPFEPQGLICEWKKQKEYELSEYLRLYCLKKL